jgi:Holliday junction resolvase RusA-like endonuclease
MNKIDILLKSSKVFDFKVCPCTAPRMTQRDKWLTPPRECVRKYFAFKTEIQWTAKKIGYELTPILNILFIIPMPETWSKKKKNEMVNEPHIQRPDRDNLLKAFQDAFGIDDGFVWDGRTSKIWGEKGEIVVYQT